MIISESVKSFNENELQNIIRDMTYQLEQSDHISSPKASMAYVKQMLKYASHLLENVNVECMTLHPMDMDKHPVYTILEKIEPNKWKIADESGKEYSISRGKDGIFKLNKRNIYCCPPKQ